MTLQKVRAEEPLTEVEEAELIRRLNAPSTTMKTTYVVPIAIAMETD